MRASIVTLVVGLAGGVAAGVVGTSLARAALPQETFTLEQNDQIIVEAPGCYAECRVMGFRRNCTLKNPGCKAVCRTLPQCRIDGKAIQACAVIRNE